MIEWIRTMDPNTYLYSGIGVWFVLMVGWFYREFRYSMELFTVETALYAVVTGLASFFWPATLIICSVGFTALIIAIVLGFITD